MSASPAKAPASPDGQALDMGTPVDTMNTALHHFHADCPAAVQVNRMRLLTVMLEADFVHHPREWWHYQLPDTQQFALIDNLDFMTGAPEARACAKPG